ncbi:MAG: MATE family efflux transporter, partial [Primorskyibacter sp.]
HDALAAAAGYASTLLFFTNSINIGLSIAAGALVARALGAGQGDEAREYASSVAVFSALTGVIMPIILMPNLRSILALLGAEGEVADLAVGYLWIILPSMAAVGIAMVAMAVLRAYGDARRSMYATLFGGVANAVFDPIFIFGFGMELQGAAIASVIARVTMLVVAVAPAIRRHNGFARPTPRMIARDMRAVSALAGPAVLTNVATPVGQAFVTSEMSKYGAEAVAGMAVIGRLIPVAFGVVLALSGAIGPIIGQNFGAQRMDRVRGALIAGLQFIAVYVVVASGLLYLLRAPIAGLFDAQGDTLLLIYLFCGPLALFNLFNGALFAANATFNNLGRPTYSTAINWGKNTLGTWPFVIAGAALGGAQGVLIGQALGGVVFAIIAVVLAFRLIAGPEGGTPSHPFRGHRRLHVLTHGGRW